MSTNRKPRRGPTLKDMAKSSDNKNVWKGWCSYDWADRLEVEYIKSLKKSKDVIEYVKKREEEVFIDNI